MREIKLTRGFVTIVDDEDYEWLNQWKWHVDPKGLTYYARRTIREGGKVKRIYMHRAILNSPQGVDTDHINHNGLDNRRCNIRVCTHQENTFNTNGFKRKSKYKGVSKKVDYDRKKPYRACLKINGKQTLIGHFKTEKEAAIAYNEVVLRERGEFAILNIID